MQRAVLDLGLCPFAAEPWDAGRVRIVVSDARTDDALLEDLYAELVLLVDAKAADVETTLLVVPHLLSKFADYNQFLDPAEELIEDHGWVGRFQIASFHPAYQFADTEPGDPANFTNRSPFPILHILRESSIAKALTDYPDTERIPLANIKTLRGLSDVRRTEIFGRQPGCDSDPNGS